MSEAELVQLAPQLNQRLREAYPTFSGFYSWQEGHDLIGDITVNGVRHHIVCPYLSVTQSNDLEQLVQVISIRCIDITIAKASGQM